MASDPAHRAGAILEVDLAGIAANWRLLARRIEPAGCAAVVKADGYGLGAAEVATTLAEAGCRLFFTATIDEGIILRRILPLPFEIAVLNGALPNCAAEFVEYRLIPVLNDPGQVTDWQQIAARRGRLPAMLHLDTGMARLGLTMREFDRIADHLPEQGAIRWRAVISHLAASLPREAASAICLPASPRRPASFSAVIFTSTSSAPVPRSMVSIRNLATSIRCAKLSISRGESCRFAK